MGPKFGVLCLVQGRSPISILYYVLTKRRRRKKSFIVFYYVLYKRRKKIIIVFIMLYGARKKKDAPHLVKPEVTHQPGHRRAGRSHAPGTAWSLGESLRSRSSAMRASMSPSSVLRIVVCVVSTVLVSV